VWDFTKILKLVQAVSYVTVSHTGLPAVVLPFIPEFTRGRPTD
jgi:hypothetical protein